MGCIEVYRHLKHIEILGQASCVSTENNPSSLSSLLPRGLTQHRHSAEVPRKSGEVSSMK